MSVQLHPDIETLDKESLCYSIYAQLYHNFFNAQQKKDDEHPYGIEEGDETSLRLKNTAYGFASAIAGAVAGEGGSGSGGLLLGYLKKSGGDMTAGSVPITASKPALETPVSWKPICRILPIRKVW